MVAFDIHGSNEDLVQVFTGQDVVISCVHASQIDAQINLIEPLKEAKVKRFIPCNFATPAPAGVMALHDRVCQIQTLSTQQSGQGFRLNVHYRVEADKMPSLRNFVFSMPFSVPIYLTPS